MCCAGAVVCSAVLRYATLMLYFDAFFVFICVDLFEHCYTHALGHREGAPTADGDMPSRILIGPVRLKHCDTNIDALCVRCVLEQMVSPPTAHGELHQLELWMSLLDLQFAHLPSSQGGTRQAINHKPSMSMSGWSTYPHLKNTVQQCWCCSAPKA